jgi:lysophospholipid acyltransferase (LPLAT)-like uncharacterized protein
MLMITFWGWILSWFLRLLSRTWRVRIHGRENMDLLNLPDARFLICFWHGKYVPIFPLLEGCKACVISSQSKRGDIIAEICRNFGYQNVQIRDHARQESLLIMEKAISEVCVGGTAVDGPLGPYHQAKSGVIRIASLLGFKLLPVSIAGRRKIMFEKRWDRMEIPLPFTMVSLVIGDPIDVLPALRYNQIRDATNHLTDAITKLDLKAECMISKAAAMKPN